MGWRGPKRGDTPDMLGRIRWLRLVEKKTWEEIAEEIGYTTATIARWVPDLVNKNYFRNRMPEWRLRAPIPDVEEIEDTRSLTGKLMGDPLPGRSALDKKRKGS